MDSVDNRPLVLAWQIFKSRSAKAGCHTNIYLSKLAYFVVVRHWGPRLAVKINIPWVLRRAKGGAKSCGDIPNKRPMCFRDIV